ncbi:Venom carboxylesterase-6 [Folsomia candida]|uniref:Venom carboxylesterase-6 n=1 Tax=Folsomia candida TaxID=158441 RepID=A0A226EZV4_FOLCA|nr:Venom carboxylesterase-6 [Folsomia candida]
MQNLGILKITVLLLFTPNLFVEGKPAGKVITIRGGDVRGRISIAKGGRLFVEYTGIPYGKAKRFELARPAPKWEGILEASKKPEPCPYQDMRSGVPHGSEDCLFINVATPKTHPKYHLKNLPVLVVIHGSFSEWHDQGGHFNGAKYFLDEDVVLVSFNYRLGPLGFLSTSDETIPANLGLKDQVLALKWVQKNIWLFGGDPGQVTLLGHGSGAAAVHYHVLSPMSKGLFHKGILQSGNSLCPWSFVDDPEKTFINYATAMNCSESLDSAPIIACLREKNASELVAVSSKANYIFNGNREETGNNVYFGPVLEHWMRNFPDRPSFINHFPQNLVANWSNETMSSVPLLIGANELDGITLDWAEHVSRQFEPIEGGSVWYDYKLKRFGLFFGYANRAGNKTSDVDGKVFQHYFGDGGDSSATDTTDGDNNVSPTEASVSGDDDANFSTTEPSGSTDSGNTFSTTETTDSSGNNSSTTETTTSSEGPDETESLSGVEIDLGDKFFHALGHRHYFQCTRKAALSHAEIAPTFLYYLTYNRNVSHLDFWIDKYGLPYDIIKQNKSLLRGAVHGDELQYLFDLDESADFPLIRKKFREMSLEFSQNLVKIWINFARQGKPTGDWEPISGEAKWQILGDTREPGDVPWNGDVDFWESLDLDGLRELPPLRELNDTRKHRTKQNGTDEDGDGDGDGDNSEFENSNDKYRDIIYLDGPGDDDGTGGLFNFPPLKES